MFLNLGDISYVFISLKTYFEGDSMIGNLMRSQKSLNQEQSKFQIQFNKTLQE